MHYFIDQLANDPIGHPCWRSCNSGRTRLLRNKSGCYYTELPYL